MIDLNTCKRGDTLVSSQGSILEYVSKTPWQHFNYLDHVVRYVTKENGEPYERDDNYGTRTNDGYAYAKNRKPETDHDIIEIKSNDLG